jgi:hypothetical protein
MDLQHGFPRVPTRAAPGAGLPCLAAASIGAEDARALTASLPGAKLGERACAGTDRTPPSETLLRLLALAEDEQRELERELRRIARSDRRCQTLETIYGVGPILACHILAELGEAKRFPPRSLRGACRRPRAGRPRLGWDDAARPPRQVRLTDPTPTETTTRATCRSSSPQRHACCRSPRLRTSSSSQKLSAKRRSASDDVAICPAERTTPFSQIATSANSRCTSRPIQRRMLTPSSNRLTSEQEAGKRHLRIRARSAHPGQSQGGQITNASSKPIQQERPARPCSRTPSSRTVAPYSPTRTPPALRRSRVTAGIHRL